MSTKIVLTLSILLGSIIAQVEMNYSYEMKYGKGKEVRGQASSNPYTTDYSYFENLLDINTYFGEKIYTFTQLEYSNPPIYGYDRDGLDSILTTFYIEYSHDKYDLKLGDIYELYGRGLSFYTFQDQNIDYNNSIKGLSLQYFHKENLRASTLIGTGDYAFRSNPSNRIADYQFTTNAILGSIDYDNQLFGYFQYVYLYQQSLFDPELMKDLYLQKNEIGLDLYTRCYEEGVCDFNELDTLKTTNYDLNWNIFMGYFDIYIDKTWIYYDKIYGNEVFGSRFYTSIYTEVLGTGITYEYKDYYTPYLLKSISNPPIVYKESNSILASRNTHSMNFENEIGHQVDLNRNLIGNMNIAANLSLSHRHQMDDMKVKSKLEFLGMSYENIDIEAINIINVLSMKDVDYMYAYYPFRQVYLEFNGWALSERLYYKVGMDYFTEFYHGKNTSAFTLPTHWVWKLSSENALTMYLEAQRKSVKRVTPGDYTNYYLSASYSHLGKWVVTGFYDQEVTGSSTKLWMGGDLSYKLNTETQISIFYGSQKGGLVCANGICAEQPGFEDGYKITFRSLF